MLEHIFSFEINNSPLLQSNPFRLDDGGPIYKETNLQHLIAEPFNASSALIFIAVAFYWFWVLGKDKQLPLLVKRLQMACAVLLLIGGIGGSLFHAFRVSKIFLLMDVVPIFLLALIFSLYLWWKQFGRRGYSFAVIPLLVTALVRWIFNEMPPHIGIGIGYAGVGIMILLPILVALYRANWYGVLLIHAALSSFIIALMCRQMEEDLSPIFPMGTHFLWHSFGAAATTFLIHWWLAVEQHKVLDTNSPNKIGVR